MFDWNDLRYLLAVSEAGTLVGAAKALGVKHTTVARRLAALESDLGARLVRKGGDKYGITPTGEEVLQLARDLKTKADAIERRVAGGDERVGGIVRVTMPDNLAGWFVKELPTLRVRHPDLTVNVLADVRVHDLLAGEADIALRLAPGTEVGLVERKLFRPAWAAYASKAYVAQRGAPTSLAEFARHDLIGFEGVIDRTPGADWIRANVPDANFVMRTSGIVPLMNAAILGVGIGLLPCFMGDGEPTLVRLSAVQVPQERRARLLVPTELVRVARVRTVMDFIVELSRRDAELFEGGRGEREEKACPRG